MSEVPTIRKLMAIIAADVCGYSRLMGLDEEGTLALLNSHRHELIDRKITEHRGRIVKTTGDGLLVEFARAVMPVAPTLAVGASVSSTWEGPVRVGLRRPGYGHEQP